MTSRNDIIKLLEEKRDTIKKFGVTVLGVFGSFARNEQNEESDVDVLVELKTKTFDAYMDLLFFLEDLFGRKVDLVMKGTVKSVIKDRVFAETIYVQGI
jgi:predicted nucleotidyltransferase